MPEIFRFNGWKFFFWSNENQPLEPIHIHFTKTRPGKDSPKFWICKNGKAIFDEDHPTDISAHELSKIKRVIEDNNEIIVNRWIEFFGDNITYIK